LRQRLAKAWNAAKRASRIETAEDFARVLISAACGLALWFAGAPPVISVLASFIVFIVFFIWRAAFPKAEPIRLMLGPLYSAEGQKTFRAQQRKVTDEIADLKMQLRTIESELDRLDSTNENDQQSMKKLSQQHAEIQTRLTQLESERRFIGFTGD
jgi:hypothetical protein